MEVSRADVEALYREKPDASVKDVERLKEGEPLAYVIGHIPFLGLSINLSSRPLIPRPETEWWAEMLCAHLEERAVSVLDLCAGSGAIGLSVLARCPNATVFFGERKEEHLADIRRSLAGNNLDASRADIRSGDLFAPFEGKRFDFIAANPPYVPATRALPPEVVEYEPPEALFAGENGFAVIRRILEAAPLYLLPGGELWLECDIANIEKARAMVPKGTIHTDPYGRPRLLVAYYA